MESKDIEDLANVATALGFLGIAIGLFFTYRQLKIAKNIAVGQFILHLDEMLRHHDKTHRRLRNGGEWAGSANLPKDEDIEAWADIEGYLGLFERVNILRTRRLIEIKEIKNFYGYRIQNIVANQKIVETKLGVQTRDGNWHDKKGYPDFLELARALKMYPPDPNKK